MNRTILDNSPTQRVYNREGTEFGIITKGEFRWCAGCGRNCRGGVRWPNGKITYPCVRVLDTRPDGARQIPQEGV